MMNRINWDIIAELRTCKHSGNRIKSKPKFERLPQFDIKESAVFDRSALVLEAKLEIERLNRRVKVALEKNKDLFREERVGRFKISNLLYVDPSCITKEIMEDMEGLGIKLELFKVCAKCKENKAYSDYWRDCRKKSGRTTRCKACHGKKPDREKRKFELSCRTCKKWKHMSKFHKQPTTRGYTYSCGECSNAYRRMLKNRKSLASVGDS